METVATSPVATLPDDTTQISAQSIMDLEKQYLLQNYARYPLVLARGKGCYVYDTAGKRYLDLITGIGVNALGHAHPQLLKTIRQQAGLMIHTSNLLSDGNRAIPSSDGNAPIHC